MALTTHQIESGHHPSIDVSVDGKTIATVKIDLQLTYTMAGVLAVIRQARLTAIRSGTCTVAGSLVDTADLNQRRNRRSSTYPAGSRSTKTACTRLTPFDDALPGPIGLSAGDAETRPYVGGLVFRSDETVRVPLVGTGHTGRSASRPRVVPCPILSANSDEP